MMSQDVKRKCSFCNKVDFIKENYCPGKIGLVYECCENVYCKVKLLELKLYKEVKVAYQQGQQDMLDRLGEAFMDNLKFWGGMLMREGPEKQ